MKNRFANNRIYRWSLLIQEYSFTIKHRPGVDNVTADALTRNRPIDTDKADTFMVTLNTLSHEHSLYSYTQVHNSQAHLQELRHKLSTQAHRGLSIKNNFIIKTIGTDEKFVIHIDLATDIIRDLHLTYGHIGVRKTWMVFRENYYCFKDLQLTKQVISKCHECCLGKPKNHTNKNIIHSITTNRPLQLVAIDFLSNLIPDKDGYKHILVMVDVFSKYVKLYPTKRCNVNVILQKLKHFTQTIGKPDKLLADNATYFNNDRIKDYLEKRGIRLVLTTIRHPKSNPAERNVQEVVRFLRMTVQYDHTEWTTFVSDVENYMNNIPGTVTKISPIVVMLGQAPIRPWTTSDKINLEELHDTVRRRIQRNATRYMDRANKKVKKKTVFKQGDLVIIKRHKVSDYKHNICAKLQYPYEGPYEISRVINDNTYELINPDNKTPRGRFHVELMYPYDPG